MSPEPFEPPTQQMPDGTWAWWDRTAPHLADVGKKGRWVPETTAEHLAHRLARHRDALAVRVELLRATHQSGIAQTKSEEP